MRRELETLDPACLLVANKKNAPPGTRAPRCPHRMRRQANSNNKGVWRWWWRERIAIINV